MNTLNLNRNTMIGTTIQFGELHAADTAAISDYATILALAKTKWTLINNINTAASGTTKGVTLDTNGTRINMQTLVVIVANGLLALAGGTNDNEMFAAANYTFNKLRNLAKDEVDDICEGIVTLATANAAALVPKGIVAADITDADSAVNVYRIAMNNPRQKEIDMKTANEKIEPIIRDIIDNIFIKQLDPLTRTLILKKPDYYAGYFSAREIIDLGHGTTKTKGTVTLKDAPIETPIFDVLITLTEAETGQTYKFKSAIAGEFAEQMKRGIYKGIAEKPGLKTTAIDPFELKQGKTIELKIEMEKEV